MGRFGTAWFWIHENDRQLKLIFGLVTVLSILLGYCSNQHEANIKRTLDFQAKYSEGELLKAHLELDALLLDRADKTAIDEAPDPPRKIMELVQAKGYERDVLILADFFSQVATCVRGGLCDLPTACAVFSDSVIRHRNNYFRLFELWQNLWGQNFIEAPYEYFRKRCAA